MTGGPRQPDCRFVCGERARSSGGKQKERDEGGFHEAKIRFTRSAGAIKIKELVRLCRADSMPAVAITDTGNLFGALEFAETRDDVGIEVDGAVVGRGRCLRDRGGERRQEKSAEGPRGDRVPLHPPRRAGQSRRKLAGATGGVNA